MTTIVGSSVSWQGTLLRKEKDVVQVFHNFVQMRNNHILSVMKRPAWWMHCRHGQTICNLGELFEVWPKKFPKHQMRQALSGEKASINEAKVLHVPGRTASEVRCRQTCRTSTLQGFRRMFLSSGMVDNYQHLPVKDMAISGKIEANGYSPCQTILYSIESYGGLGIPHDFGNQFGYTIGYIYASPLNENVQVWLHHWEVSV